MNFSFASLKTWLLSFLPAKGIRRELAIDILKVVFDHLPEAMSIVEAIEAALKPAVNSSSDPIITTIENFLGKGLQDADLTAARLEAQRIAYFPRAELFTCVAIFLLNRQASTHLPSWLLRLVIVYAYAQFVGSKDETTIPRSN